MRKPTVFGKYLLLERINVGGMAEVFIAKAFGVEGFERILAIKKILPTMAEDEEFITMFIDEARISVQLSHANIVHIHELGRYDGAFFIAMEYVSGKDVRTMLEQYRKNKELMPVPQAVFIASKICEGLDYAHRKKDARGRDLHIIHRDVSPQNILVSFDGEVKIIDFGIAKAANRSQHTQAGILKGKFGYMSPEQVRGLPIDRRSDIFAVGVILYEMLTGEKLFVGESDFSTLEQVRNAEVPLPRQFNPNIPAGLEKVLMKALAREQDDRYQWASDLQEDLMRFLLAGETIYSAKHLAGYMKQSFAEDLLREGEKMERYANIERPDEIEPSGLMNGELPKPRPSAPRLGVATASGRAPSAPPVALALGDESINDRTQIVITGEHGVAADLLAQEHEPTQAPAIPKPRPSLPAVSSAPSAYDDTTGEMDRSLFPPLEPDDAPDTRPPQAPHPTEGELDTRPPSRPAEEEGPPPSDVEELPTRPPLAAPAKPKVPAKQVVIGEPNGYTGATVVGPIPTRVGPADDSQVAKATLLLSRSELEAPAAEGDAAASPTDSNLRSVDGGDEPNTGKVEVAEPGEVDLPPEPPTLAGPLPTPIENEPTGKRARPSVPAPPAALRASRGVALGGEFSVFTQVRRLADERRWLVPAVAGGVGCAVLAIALALFLGRGGTLVVTLEQPVSEASALLNGEPLEIGRRVKVPKGKYRVAVNAPGHEQVIEELEVRAGSNEALVVALRPLAEPEPAPATFTLKVTSSEPGVEISLDGRRVGLTPEVTLANLQPRQRYRVTAVKAGFKPYEAEVVEDGTRPTVALAVTLERLETGAKPKAPPEKKPVGKFVCSSEPVGAEVWVNNRNTGRVTPVPQPNPLLLPHGRHEVFFRLNGRKTKVYVVEVDGRESPTPLIGKFQ